MKKNRRTLEEAWAAIGGSRCTPEIAVVTSPERPRSAVIVDRRIACLFTENEEGESWGEQAWSIGGKLVKALSGQVVALDVDEPWDTREVISRLAMKAVALEMDSEDRRPLCPECGAGIYGAFEQYMRGVVVSWDGGEEAHYGGFDADPDDHKHWESDMVELYCPECGWSVDPRKVKVWVREEELKGAEE